MATFASIYTQLQEQIGSPLLAATDLKDEDVEAVETIRRGMRLRNQTAPSDTFWADLQQMASSNRNGLAALLGVRPEVVSRWSTTIKHYMNKVQQIDNFSNGQKKPQVIQTGLNATNAPKVGINGSFGDYNISQTGPM
jgi:hypothetical protein